ncbi:MAG TPA: hypothetical protein VK846_08030 [Candidatus Limnocylindria bacterium]|nr:hypothetical protein [Candidatus Limnocylindria bacterium]
MGWGGNECVAALFVFRSGGRGQRGEEHTGLELRTLEISNGFLIGVSTAIPRRAGKFGDAVHEIQKVQLVNALADAVGIPRAPAKLHRFCRSAYVADGPSYRLRRDHADGFY